MGWFFVEDKRIGATYCHGIDIAAELLTLLNHLLHEGNQFRTDLVEKSQKLFSCDMGEVSQLFCLVHYVQSFLVLRKHSIPISEHFETVELPLMLVLGLSRNKDTSERE